MNLRQMEAFRAVMLTGSVSQAAKQLFKTQPAVSMLISSLEEDIGFKLFERHKNRITPTQEAQYLYKEVEAIFSRMSDVSQTVQDIQNKQYGFLRIGSMLGPSTYFMPQLVADFMEEHPKIQISLQTRTTVEVKEWVASAQYDIGLTDITDHDPAVEMEIFEFPCMFAVPAQHQLASEQLIIPEMLDNLPLITLHPDHMTFHALQHILQSSGHRMNVRMQTRYFYPTLQFVERGLGLSIVDPITVASYCGRNAPGQIVFRQFQPDVNFRFAILFPSDRPRSLLTQSFAEKLRHKITALENLVADTRDWETG